MKWKLAAKMAMLVQQLLGIEEIPIDGEAKKVAFSEEQKTQMLGFLATEEDYNEMMNQFNKDLSNMESESQREERLKNELRTALQENTNLTENEIDNKVKEGDVATQLSAMNETMRQQKAQIEKLINTPEGDSPVAEGLQIGAKMKNSKTHLFGGNEAYNAFEGRAWNQRAAGLTTDATDFTDSTTVNKLNGDLDLYFRENPDEIKSLHRDNFGLPSFWPKRLNVDDKVSDGFIVSAEISQARKLPWLPKNKQSIQPEEGQIFPVQIDIEFVGHYLQKIEASWLNFMNKEGSQPYKTSFVRFLVGELDKKARVEDRISTIKGVHVATPDDATVAGKFINRQDGLLYQFFKGRDVTKKYKAFKLGTPTTINIVDYVDAFMESLPLDVRRNPNLKFYLSPAWLTAYDKRYEQIHATQTDYKGVPPYPKGYPTCEFESLVDLEGLDFMFVTFDDNIELLENVPKEKSLYHFEYLKRMIYIWADYKQGVRLIHIGNKLKEGDPLEFKVQTVWSNDVPIFHDDFAIPVFDDETGEIEAKFNVMQVDAGWKTPVTQIKGAAPGQLIKIIGNTGMAATKNVNSTGNIGVSATFDLKSGGTLTLYVKADGSIVELSRTTGPATAAATDTNFDSDTIDASESDVFYFIGEADTTLAEILKGVEGSTVTIYGTDTVDVEFTVTDVEGKISVTEDAVLASKANTITLVKVGGMWYESERTIA